MSTKDNDCRPEFEAWLASCGKSPLMWNTSDAMLAAWGAATRTQREALARVEAERDAMESMVVMLEEKEWAEHAGKGPVSERLETCITDLHNDLSEANERADAAQAQLAEAVILIGQVQDCRSFDEVKVISRFLADFLARHAQAEQQEAQGAQAGDEPKIPPMGKLDIPVRGVPLNECHSCGWLGGENEVPGEEDQCYCPNCHSDNIDDDVNLPRLFHLVRYLASAALATQPADTTTSDKYRAELYDEVWQKARGMGYVNVTMALVALERLDAAPPAAAHGDEAVRKDAERYLWLLESRDGMQWENMLRCCDLEGQEGISEFIDAAMRAQAGEGGDV